MSDGLREWIVRQSAKTIAVDACQAGEEIIAICEPSVHGAVYIHSSATQ